METWVMILIAIIPAIVVGGVVIYIVKQFLERDQQQRAYRLKENARNTLLPVKLQAYERMVILLERVRINNLVMRVHKPGMNAQYMQAEMVKTIRSEFEHNLSQQLYVSNTAWKMVILAREEMLQMLNLAGKEVSGEDSATAYSQKLLEISHAMEKSPIDEAIYFLKKEMMHFF